METSGKKKMRPWIFFSEVENVEFRTRAGVLSHLFAGCSYAGKESGIKICQQPGKDKRLRRDRGPRFAIPLVRFAAIEETQAFWPAWDVLIVVAPSDGKKHLIKRAKLKWKKKNDEELSEGVWFEPISAFLRRKWNDKWAPRQAACARTLVINGSITQETLP